MLLPTGVPTKRPDIITLKAALIFSADIKKKMRLTIISRNGACGSVRTQLFGNFLDTRVSKVEQLTGSLYFQLVEIVQRGTTRVAQEELPEMGGGNSWHCGQCRRG